MDQRSFPLRGANAKLFEVSTGSAVHCGAGNLARGPAFQRVQPPGKASPKRGRTCLRDYRPTEADTPRASHPGRRSTTRLFANRNNAPTGVLFGPHSRVV